MGFKEEMEKLKPCESKIEINLWGHDLWQQFKTQINTPSISETKHNIKNASKRNITKYYQEQLQIAQGIQKIGAIIGGLSMVPTILPLK